MKILIVEDEARIARRLNRMCNEFFGGSVESIQVCESLVQALTYLSAHEIDLLLLDLNLNGEDGFELLQRVTACAFHTVIISAYTEKAITAFAFGVLDFVPKPFTAERLEQALQRITGPRKKAESQLQFLSVKTSGSIRLIKIEELKYIQGAGIYTELHLKNNTSALHDKSLEKLEQLLPGNFERIHKSYLVPLDHAVKILVTVGGKYDLLLKTGEVLPIGRSRYKALKERLLMI